jgi:hypothetical protein
MSFSRFYFSFSVFVLCCLSGCVSILHLQTPDATPTQTLQTPETTLIPNSTPSTEPAPLPTVNGDAKPAIRLAWFYKPPVTTLSTLPKAYDFFILTHQDESYRDQIKTQGIKAPILQYLLMSEIMNPGDCTTHPNNDQVAFHPGDYCWIQDNHPDWFLKGVDGLNVGQGQYAMMDAGNTGWLDFWLQRAQYMQENFGWNGIFLDNVEGSLAKLMDWGRPPVKYTDDASYQAAVENALKYFYTSYFQPTGRPVFANIIEVKDLQVWRRYLQYLDGALLENFATGWASENGLSTADWELQMQMALQAQAMGKTVILVAQGERYDQKREQFALASYLLVNDGLAYFRYTNSNHYEEVWDYPNLSLDLGAPLAARYQDGKTWKRDFTHGSVTVDPEAQTAEITTH